MIEPIVVEFDVEAEASHAFDVWTRRCGSWWPPSHSMSQSDDFEVVFEPFAGGRIYEKGTDGTEFEWGLVTVWEPPQRIEYLWHIFLDRERATMVSVTFRQRGNRTTVRLENSGFEAFGEEAEERQRRVGTAWIGLTGEFHRELATS